MTFPHPSVLLRFSSRSSHTKPYLQPVLIQMLHCLFLCQAQAFWSGVPLRRAPFGRHDRWRSFCQSPGPELLRYSLLLGFFLTSPDDTFSPRLPFLFCTQLSRFLQDSMYYPSCCPPWGRRPQPGAHAVPLGSPDQPQWIGPPFSGSSLGGMFFLPGRAGAFLFPLFFPTKIPPIKNWTRPYRRRRVSNVRQLFPLFLLRAAPRFFFFFFVSSAFFFFCVFLQNPGLSFS